MEQKRLYLKSYEYIAADGIHTRGDSDKQKEVKKSGYRKLRGSNGTYLMVRPANARLYFFDSEGRKYILEGYEAKETILNYYGKTKISQNLVEQCVGDILNGKIQVFLIRMVIRFI